MTRKLFVMIWHVLSGNTEYTFARPAFTAMKLRKVALRAHPVRQSGAACSWCPHRGPKLPAGSQLHADAPDRGVDLVRL